MKTSKIVWLMICIGLASCSRSPYNLLTHNNIAYWMLRGRTTRNNIRAVYMEYSLKDTTCRYWLANMNTEKNSMKLLPEETWVNQHGGLRFCISNDTLYHCVRFEDLDTAVVRFWRIAELTRKRLTIMDDEGNQYPMPYVRKKYIRKLKKE